MRYTLLLLNSMANWGKLSRAWHKDFLTTDPSSASPSNIKKAIERTLPLLHDNPAAVPFVCRYRADVIDPLSTKQVHTLSSYIQKYDSLASLRNKILPHLQFVGNAAHDNQRNEDLLFRVETSISKSELEDIFAPFKPPSKGSLEDRIRSEHPMLVDAIDELWVNGSTNKRISPRDAAVTLLGNRIANNVAVMDASMEFCASHCKVQVKQSATASSAKGKKGKEAKPAEDLDKYKVYFDFQSNFRFLRDHQVLAIRRGVNQKVLKLAFDIDNERAERIIGAVLSRKHALYNDAIHDAWTRLIRKRCTSRLWKKYCGFAEERSIDVFCDNLYKALLSPPATATQGILALDPGFQAGIKCAVLSSSGSVVTLDTVKFVGNERERGKQKLIDLLQKVNDMVPENGQVDVVLGNGHGTREARELVIEAAAQCDIPINVHIVSEAGASVWSVTEMASKEFPNEKAAAVAAASIGRRYLNPLDELVKIPPRSLGLGMYQHDLPEKVLDEKLNSTCIDAVAAVGVDINSCSIEILEKVPSLTTSLCEKITKSRPLTGRNDLLKVAGLGSKTFENCAAFIRVTGGNEPLDATLVHPESYDLARWLLKKLKWKLDDPASAGKLLEKDERREEWGYLAKAAASQFQYPEDRIYTVIEHLLFSITSPDPRLRGDTQSSKKTEVGSPTGCSSLPPNLSTTDTLKQALPVRRITATVRNVVDFGAFVDFGGANDGLLHRSKFGPVSLDSLLVGQEIGVDILGVSNAGRISLGLSGLNLSVENMDAEQTRRPPAQKQSASKRQRRK